MLIGNLGRDPELRHSASGGAVGNLAIATNESWKDKQTGELQERTEWHRIVTFGRMAEICSEHLHKGSKVYIEGRLQTRKWQDKDGNDRYTTEIVANDMQMLDSKSDTGQQPAPRQEKYNGREDAKRYGEATGANMDDDIPF